MTKSSGTATEANDDVSPSWGTWEELLLAFAVNRHGTGAWDSIAAELQKRNSVASAALTAHNCRLKYLDLRRRYVAHTDDLDDVAAADNDKSNDDDSVSLLEELRKLRVAELRREVQRYDLNIESLELKMKKMEEEREKISRRDESDPEKNEEEPESERANGGEPVTGDESEKDHLSVNESNSTDLGAEKVETEEKKTEPARTGRMQAEPTEVGNEPDKKSVRADSCNGSSNSIEKELKRKKKVEAGSDSAESKGGRAELAKENSDVQSSASRSREEEEEGKDKVRRGSTSGDERGHEDQSRAVNESSAEVQRLIDFLQAIRSHKFGSVFERRLWSQESSKYQKLILQHVDLETMETRLKEGWYSGSKAKFFRDLLLLVNNALVFFNKNSSEAKAATEVRKLITIQMSQKSTKSDSSSGKHASLQSLSISRKDEPQLKAPTCRPRSSIAVKTDKKKEQQTAILAQVDSKLQHSGNSEEPKITKKRTRDRISSPVLSNSKNGNTQPKNSGNKSSVELGKQQVVIKGGSFRSESKTENKKNQSIVDSKKQEGVMNNNCTLADALKKMPFEKKNNTVKRGEKKEHVNRRCSEMRQGKEKGSPEKKNVGRPPKRGAAPPPPPAALGKRGRDRGEGESGGSKQQPKKRSRKL